jgi:hypothetical protein
MKKGLKYYLCILANELMWPGLSIRWKQGFYSFNGADSESPVLVTVDFYLTAHRVIESIERQELKCHLLVVNSRGINVWCGSRGGHVNTDSVLDALEEFDVKNKVSHKRLILPQLSASAISKSTLAENGWRAKFGPVDIDDVGDFIHNDLKKSPGQNIITFDLKHRLEENIGHLFLETILFLIMTLIFWVLNFISPPFTTWYFFWSTNLLFILLSAYVLGTFMAIADSKIPTTSGLVRGIVAGIIGLIIWKLSTVFLFMTPLVWLDPIGLTILGVSLFIGFNWGGATPYLSESQMIRDIIVGIGGLVILFALGYYFPGGIF